MNTMRRVNLGKRAHQQAATQKHITLVSVKHSYIEKHMQTCMCLLSSAVADLHCMICNISMHLFIEFEELVQQSVNFSIVLSTSKSCLYPLG